jgi:hypothetical protein
VHASFVQAVAPALPLAQLLKRGRTMRLKLREGRRRRTPQMTQLVSLTNHVLF